MGMLSIPKFIGGYAVAYSAYPVAPPLACLWQDAHGQMISLEPWPVVGGMVENLTTSSLFHSDRENVSEINMFTWFPQCSLSHLRTHGHIHARDRQTDEPTTSRGYTPHSPPPRRFRCLVLSDFGASFQSNLSEFFLHMVLQTSFESLYT